MVAYVRGMLSACGHDVTVVYDNIYPQAINLYLEHFVGPAYAEKFRNLRRNHGVRIGVVATELIVSSGQQRIIPYAKHGIAYGQSENDHAAIIAQRVAGFERVLPEIDFLWSFLERTANEFRSSLRCCEFLPVGCIDLLDDQLRRSPRDIDIVFFGKNTPHRQRVLGYLGQQRTKVVVVGSGFSSGWFPQCMLDSLLDRAKIGLNLTLHAAHEAEAGTDPRFVSCLRVADMLSRKLAVVSEDILLDNPYSECMESAPIEGLSALCRSLLDTGAWADVGVRNGERFRSTMDVRKICGPVIERTLAALS
jgi:hypothetical protein